MSTETVPTPKEICDEIARTLLLGLTTDGAHHKQWCLEHALRELAGNEFVDKARVEFGFVSGVAP